MGATGQDSGLTLSSQAQCYYYWGRTSTNEILAFPKSRPVWIQTRFSWGTKSCGRLAAKITTSTSSNFEISCFSHVEFHNANAVSWHFRTPTHRSAKSSLRSLRSSTIEKLGFGCVQQSEAQAQSDLPSSAKINHIGRSPARGTSIDAVQ